MARTARRDGQGKETALSVDRRGLPRLARLCHNPKSPFSERSGNENQRLDVGIAPPMPIIRAERAMVSVHLLPSLIPPGGLHGGVAVVIDVLRASTMIVHALVAGCTAVMPCGEVDEARRLAASLPAGSALLAGERHGVPIEGFDLGNSPGECTPAVCQGKTMVITTTNGTRALLACLDADPVVVGSFVNFAATSQRLLHEARPIHLVCAGTEGRVSYEDTLLAGAFAKHFKDLDHRMANDEAEIAAGLWARVEDIDLVQERQAGAGRRYQPSGSLLDPGTGRAARGRVGAQRRHRRRRPPEPARLPDCRRAPARPACASWPVLDAEYRGEELTRRQETRQRQHWRSAPDSWIRWDGKAGLMMDLEMDKLVSLVQAPRVHLPLERDLWRNQRLLGLRSARRRAEAEHQGGLVARQRPDRATTWSGSIARSS